MTRLVTFLTDFGTDDVFVGLCHAVLARLAPEARVVDLTHAIPPQDVEKGALVLADAVTYAPGAVHLAVVDPGVGTERRGLAVRAGVGDREALLVGPDNGLLLPAADRLGGVTRAVALTSEAHRLPEVSATFHGRDVFAPAAGHLASGGELEELGPPVETGELVRLELPKPESRDGWLRVCVRDIDRFGNVQLWARPDDLELTAQGEPESGSEHITLSWRGALAALPYDTTFATLPDEGLGLLADSFGWLAVVVRGDSAAERLGLVRGDHLSLRRDGTSAERQP
ncbi:MAG: SAM hydrolase/SAM-dependent halogenase family protein [Egibacteraceae bacterium]